MLEKLIFGENRTFLVNVNELAKLLQVLNQNGITCMCFEGNMKVGNCGWKKAPDCWFVAFRSRDKVYYKILKSISESKITLLPETTGY